jgi:hypothetical protein
VKEEDEEEKERERGDCQLIKTLFISQLNKNRNKSSKDLIFSKKKIKSKNVFTGPNTPSPSVPAHVPQ